MENMSEGILFDILLWIPVVCLLRFKRVCKSWLALIESSTFVYQHLHHHSGEDALIVPKTTSRDLDLCLFSGNKYEVCTTIDFDDRFSTIIRANVSEIELVDSCDGIICLHNGWRGDVALWNPALKQLRPLPKSSISHQLYNQGNPLVQFNIVGFGFDAKANDYKVVRIIWHSTRPEANQVEVYSLNTTFSWRIIHKNDALPFKNIQGHSNHATSKNGTCFWLGEDNHCRMLLVAFDLKNEAFETMSLPETQEPKPYYALDFLNEKLVCIRGLNSYRDDYFEFWSLHEFGVKEYWNKLYNIGPIPFLGRCGLFPTGFSINGEFLLLKSSFRCNGVDELYLYHLCTQEATEECYAPIQVPNPYFLRSFSHYNESLVSLKNVVNGGK